MATKRFDTTQISNRTEISPRFITLPNLLVNFLSLEPHTHREHEKIQQAANEYTRKVLRSKDPEMINAWDIVYLASAMFPDGEAEPVILLTKWATWALAFADKHEE